MGHQNRVPADRLQQGEMSFLEPQRLFLQGLAYAALVPE